MAKLKQNQFYCVKCSAKKTCKKDNIGVKVYTNKRTKTKVPTLKCSCPKCGTNMTKFIKHADEQKLTKKFGKW